MWDVVGHRRIVEGLQRALETDHLPHALLLTGPAGIGKTRLALELAKALNCIGTTPPCGTCVHCRQIAGGSHPDVTIVEPAEAKDSIAIAQVRDLRDAASLRPFQGRKKVYIIAGAEMLTAQAADALLKTLEEPQPQVSLILTASETDALPATIVSRCRVVAMGPVDRGQIERALNERGQAPDNATRIARLAQGRAGWAFRAAKNPRLLQQAEAMIEQLGALPGMGIEGRLQLAEDLAGDRKDRSVVRRNLEFLLLLVRDLLLLSQGLESQLANTTLRDEAQAYTLADIDAALRGIRTAMQRIDQNVDPRLSIEALFMGLP